MPRFIHKVTGSIVDCSDEVAANLPHEFEPEQKAPAKKAAAKPADKK